MGFGSGGWPTAGRLGGAWGEVAVGSGVAAGGGEEEAGTAWRRPEAGGMERRRSNVEPERKAAGLQGGAATGGPGRGVPVATAGRPE